MLDGLERAVATVPLTVLTAPKGYGKTHLVQAWARTSQRRVVVVTLQADDDVASFGLALLDAVSAAGASEWLVLTEERRAAAVADRHVAERLLADLSGRAGLALVVDAVDAPQDGEVQDQVAALLRTVAGPLPVVVTRRSRRSNGLAGGAWSAAVRLIDHDELALTAEEAASLVPQVNGRSIEADALGVLMARTNGWPEAVLLAAERVQARGDPTATWDLALQGVADVTTHAVLETLAPSAARFLVGTSVLDRMDGSSCDAVTEGGNGRVMLRVLERRGAPIWRTDPDGHWYRVHPLLREGLRRMLRLSGPDAERQALRRASRWFSDHDAPSEAAGYLVEGEDWRGVVELADRCGRRMFETSSTPSLVEWLEAIPHGAVAETGAPAVTHTLRLAAAHTMVGSTRRGEQLLSDTVALTAGEQAVVDALRSARVYIDGDPRASLVAAERVLDRIDQLRPSEVPNILGMTSPSMLAQMARVSAAEAHWLLGDVSLAEGQFSAMLALDQLPYPPWRIHATGSLALLEAWSGRLTSAHEHACLALRTARMLGLGRHVAVAHATLAAGHVILERSASPPTDDLFKDALAVVTPLRRPMTKAVYAVERATWCLARGRPDEALEALEWHQQAGEAPPPQLVADRMGAVEARAHLDAGRLTRAAAVLAGAERPFSAALAPVAVRLAVERGDLDEARAVLALWAPPAAEERNRLDHDLWSAIVDFEGGHRTRGLRGAEQVVASARAESHQRLFIDSGPRGWKLLRTLHLERSVAPWSVVSGAAVTAAGLSQREVEVLRYLSTPMSNAEIAAHLFISINTLKTHLRAVYRKLEVPGRQEAAARAQDLGIA